MNDDQLLALLRDTPLPADPLDRYDAVAHRSRRQARQRYAVAVAGLMVVALVGGVAVVSGRGRSSAAQLTSGGDRPGSAHVVTVTHIPGQPDQTTTSDVDFASGQLDLRTVDGLRLRVIGADQWFSLPGGSLTEHAHLNRSLLSSAALFDPHRTVHELQRDHAKVMLVRTTGDRAEYEAVLPALGTAIHLVLLDGDVQQLRYTKGATTITSTYSELDEVVHVVAPKTSFEQDPSPKDVEPTPFGNPFAITQTSHVVDTSTTVEATLAPRTPADSSKLSSTLTPEQCALLRSTVKDSVAKHGSDADQRAAAGAFVDHVCPEAK